jgi:uncharacterized MAPEG superfamily protein
MILVIALVILALVTGVLGAIIHTLWWLFVLTVIFLIAAFLVGRGSRR